MAFSGVREELRHVNERRIGDVLAGHYGGHHRRLLRDWFRRHLDPAPCARGAAVGGYSLPRSSCSSRAGGLRRKYPLPAREAVPHRDHGRRGSVHLPGGVHPAGA